MRAVKIILLVLIFIVLFVGLDVIQAGLDGQALLRPGPYLRSLRAHRVYDSVGEVLAFVFLGEGGGQQLPAAEQEKAKAALLEAAGPEWVEGKVTAILGDLSAFVRGQKQSFEAGVPTGELADRFMEAYAKTGSPVIVRELRRELKSVPETFPLKIDPAVLGMVGNDVRLANTVMTVAAVVWLALALLCFPLAGGFPGGARWNATALLLSGLLGLAVSVAVPIGAQGMVPGMSLGGGPPEVAAFIRNVADSIVGAVAGTFRRTAFVYVAAAVLLYALAAVVAGARARKRAAGATAAVAGAAAGAGAAPGSGAAGAVVGSTGGGAAGGAAAADADAKPKLPEQGRKR